MSGPAYQHVFHLALMLPLNSEYLHVFHYSSAILLTAIVRRSLGLKPRSNQFKLNLGATFHGE
jgi:hypothetical protein